MSVYDKLRSRLKTAPRKWLVTGVAGFIGSNLLEELLKLDQSVAGLDNFSTGKQANLEEVEALVSPKQRSRFRFIEGDITDLATCEQACAGMDFVLHQAALGSVPRSIKDPVRFHQSNVTGFLNLLVAARDARVKRFVYASSSSVYGDDPDLPKSEVNIGKPLSPYAATKAMGETYANVFAKVYGMETVGLRYFNVFGPRQDSDGAYAAVIPKWIAAMLQGEQIVINGDGETSRDFCFIENVVQANLLAAQCPAGAVNQVYNIAVGERTTLNELHCLLSQLLIASPQPPTPSSLLHAPKYQPFRPGDVRHSLASISKAEKFLDYSAKYRIQEGLQITLDWYRRGTPTGGRAVPPPVLC